MVLRRVICCLRRWRPIGPVAVMLPGLLVLTGLGLRAEAQQHPGRRDQQARPDRRRIREVPPGPPRDIRAPRGPASGEAETDRSRAAKPRRGGEARFRKARPDRTASGLKRRGGSLRPPRGQEGFCPMCGARLQSHDGPGRRGRETAPMDREDRGPGRHGMRRPGRRGPEGPGWEAPRRGPGPRGPETAPTHRDDRGPRHHRMM